MNQANTTDPCKSLFILAALTIVFAGMKASVNILVPMLLAVFISIICSYPLRKLREHNVSSGLSIFIVITGVMIIGILLSYMLGNSFGNFSSNLHIYQARIGELLAAISPVLDKIGIEIDFAEWREYFDPGAAFGFIQTLFTGLRQALTNVFLIGLTVIFILLEIPFIQDSNRGYNHDYLLIINKIQHYFGIKTMTSLLTGIIIAIWLAVIGIDYPVLWGLLAFMLNFIPSIGSIIAAVPAVLLALVMNGVVTAVLAVAGYAVVNVTIGNVIEPRVMGQGLGLRMLVVFVSLIFWGWVLGPIGMLLAVPLPMTLKILLEGYEQTRVFAMLLEPASTVIQAEGPDQEVTP